VSIFVWAGFQLWEILDYSTFTFVTCTETTQLWLWSDSFYFTINFTIINGTLVIFTYIYTSNIYIWTLEIFTNRNILLSGDLLWHKIPYRALDIGRPTQYLQIKLYIRQQNCISVVENAYYSVLTVQKQSHLWGLRESYICTCIWKLVSYCIFSGKCISHVHLSKIHSVLTVQKSHLWGLPESYMYLEISCRKFENGCAITLQYFQ